MPTDQLAAPEGAQGAKGGAPFRPTPLRAAGRAGAWLLRLWTEQSSRCSLRTLHAFNDHMLADIGLHRDARAPRGVRPHEPWFFARHLR
jgi:uncharacterized protein YjiS (DUF1127 family)